ncbi:MAG: SBBP repeat-containing protein [Thermomicrobiales bacterium]
MERHPWSGRLWFDYGYFDEPSGIDTDDDGNIYVAGHRQRPDPEVHLRR